MKHSDVAESLKKENESLKLLLQRLVDDRDEIESRLRILFEAALTPWQNNRPNKDCKLGDCRNCYAATEESFQCPSDLRELGIALSDIEELI